MWAVGPRKIFQAAKCGAASASSPGIRNTSCQWVRSHVTDFSTVSTASSRGQDEDKGSDVHEHNEHGRLRRSSSRRPHSATEVTGKKGLLPRQSRDSLQQLEKDTIRSQHSHGSTQHQGKSHKSWSEKGKGKASDSTRDNDERTSKLKPQVLALSRNRVREAQGAVAAAKAETTPEDPLALAQDQLRAYFSSKSSRLPSTTSASATLTSTTGTSLHVDGIDVTSVLPSASIDMLGAESNTFSEHAGDLPSFEQRFSRPTLDQIQKSNSDDFAGLYQSETAWNPDIDYTLMQDGPERRSFLRDALSEGRRQYIVVILDSDNLLFHSRHLRQGYDGGKFVYEELRHQIAKKHQLIPHKLDLRVRAFCALHPLTTVLDDAGVVRRGALLDFIQGLTDSGLHNYVVNVGRGNQAADLRVKAALADAIQDPHCFRAYLGGLDDFGYMEELNAIKEMGLLEKKVNLIQVPGFAVESNYYKEYVHRALDLDYLFQNQEAAFKDVPKYKKDVVAEVVPDPHDSASKPCAFHHLGRDGCEAGSLCRYSHEPISVHHKERLRAIYKRRKCPAIARGEECAFGDDCLFGHT